MFKASLTRAYPEVQDLSIIRCFAAAVTQATAFACEFAQADDYHDAFGFQRNMVWFQFAVLTVPVTVGK